MRVHTVKGNFPAGETVFVLSNREKVPSGENGLIMVRLAEAIYGLRAVNFRDEQIVAGGVGDHFAIWRRPGIHCLNVTDTMWRTAEDREAPQRTYGRNSVCVRSQ